jgi:hypothetical protein
MKRKKHNKQLSKSSKPKSIPVILGNLSEKSLRSWDLPEFYKDENCKCIDCGTVFLFTAEEQRCWYEVEKRYYWQRPIRCSLDHDIWRDKRKHKFDMDKNLEDLKESPEDDEIMLKCAESIIQFHKDTDNGNLQLASSLLQKLKILDKRYQYCKEQIKKS